MNEKFKDWTLIEGQIPGEFRTESPGAAQVVAALEALRSDLENPYVILEAPESEDEYTNYCQARAAEDATYCLEIRLFTGTGDEFRHYRLMRPDEEGSIGKTDPDRANWISGYFPDLATATAAFLAFGANPNSLPLIDGWQWVDITADFDG